jgi:hypothetical protein
VTAKSGNSSQQPTFATVTRLLGASILRPTSHKTAKAEAPRNTNTEIRSTSTDHAKSDLAEKDTVRYNELLAGYFSRPAKNSQAPAEPPSLHEWIEQGKPNF